MQDKVEGYYRQPAILGDRILFVCEDDLFVVSAEGGTATRLTAGRAEVSQPRFSPDGRAVAFVGREEGPPEVYIMPALGGEARRLTYEGTRAIRLACFSQDGKSIIYATSATRPFFRELWLREIDVTGGISRPLNLGPALSFAKLGKVAVIGREPMRDAASWKRYRGGTAGTIWVDPDGSGEFHQLVRLEGNLSSPCFAAERVFFLSDHEGTGNVYSCKIDGSDQKRHTDHEDYYARDLTSDGKRLAYRAGADIYLLEPAADHPKRLEIALLTSRTQRNRRFVPAAAFLDSADLSHDGTALAITARGKAFSMANWEHGVCQHGAAEGVRYRHLAWFNDHERLLASRCDGAGREVLVIMRADGTKPERPLDQLDTGRVLSIETAPTRDLAAITNHRQEVMVVDLSLADPSLRLIETSSYGRIAGTSFSPDSRWLAYSFQEGPRLSTIKIYDVENQVSRPVTEPIHFDVGPAFDPDGKYLYFIGYRDFDPVYDALQFDLGFPRGSRPYAITLRRELPSPFVPEPRAPLSKEELALQKAAAGKRPEPEKVRIDFEDITARARPFPVPEGRYDKILGACGKALFLSEPVQGALHQEWPEPDSTAKGKLTLFDFESLKSETLYEQVSDAIVARDHHTLLYRSGRRLRVVPAALRPPMGRTGNKDDEKPGRQSGWIDLNRIRISVTPNEEWRQMLGEAWRLQREQFWTKDLSGIDWDDVRSRYEPLVARVATRSELSDLMWEVQGELGTSHAYEIGGEYRKSPFYRQGYLGAEFEPDPKDAGFRVVSILRGDTWNEEATSPLLGPGVAVKPGDTIVAINGQPIGQDSTPLYRLVNQAGNQVSLTVKQADGNVRTVTVRALKDELPAAYRDWVRANRAYVAEKTAGRVGYLHVPDMGPQGYSEFHRSFLQEYERDALIVDVRMNGGGHVSPLLLEKLARKRIGYGFSRWGKPESYPEEAPAGPIVALTNEYAGSDGDIFSHAFKRMRLGPLVGKRTWGGVIGINPRHRLADGTVTTQPEYSFWFDDVGWGVENHGVDPDVEVDNAPHDYANGIDRQLDKAIELVLKRLDECPPHRPNPTERPSLKRPELPPRKA